MTRGRSKDTETKSERVSSVRVCGALPTTAEYSYHHS